MDEKKRQKRQAAWLAIGSLLWGLGSVGIWVFWEFLLGLERLTFPHARNMRTDGAFDVRLVSPNFRLSRDQAGHIRASFVRFRMGLDNGVAYVYDPQDKLTAEIFAKNGKTEYATTGLGWALSGFGILSGITPLGDHWYRCGFT
ncbi:hypothetical protein [Armatimonas sp.]|uniref:hypothetical protein n=1 Tax=Armatimonas sp. TaxID=1872638 RepID=UPI003752BE69